jgi:hypothetical protein
MTVNYCGKKVSSFYSLKGYLRKRKGAIRWMLVINLMIWGIAFFSYKALDISMVSANGTLVIEKTVQPTFEQIPTEIKDTVNYFCELYGVDCNLVHKLISCESKGNPNAIGDTHLALSSRGLFQFQPTTFFSEAKLYKVRNADINDWRDQILVAVMMIRDGKADAWSCYKIVK